MTIRFAYEYFRYLTPSRNLSLQLSLRPDARFGLRDSTILFRE